MVDFLPPLAKVEEQFSVAAIFVRPFFVGTNRTLMHMFDDLSMLSRMNNATRTFDQSGLSQGMPFVWQALDPNVATYSITS